MTSYPEESNAQGPGLVGGSLLGVHHIGIPVRNLERSLQWYATLFGLHHDGIEISEGAALSTTVRLKDARLRSAFLELGNTLIELLEYEQPRGRDFDRANCDVGTTHVCLETDNIARVHRALERAGVSFSSGPVRLSGRFGGHQCCYFRDPDGIQFELWQRPQSEEEAE